MNRFFRTIALSAISLSASLFPSVTKAYVDGVGETDDKYTPTILVVRDDEEVTELENEGVIIWHRRADMALALVPNNISDMAREKGSRRWHRGRRLVPTLDVARNLRNAEFMHTGRNLPASYTGRGVVVGMCDTGFDPDHIAFLDENGDTRVKRLVYYDEPKGVRKLLDTPAEIAAWTTDNESDFHGTHVANIMAGSYAGAGYSGMAPDAEIVAATSMLYDVGILSACEDIIEYAKSVGKPAVINLSVGSYNGPHDGTTLFNRYMALLGEEAIICMASGNEGNRNAFNQITFSDGTPDWKVLLYSSDWTQFHMYGMTDAWSSDQRPVGVRISVYDEYTKREIWQSEKFDCSEPFEYVLSSDSDNGFGRYMKGYIRARGYLCDLNGRWATEVEYETEVEEPNPDSGGKWARYIIGLTFNGAPGVHADISADCQYTWTRPWPGYPAAGTALSVSDIATGDNVVVVGMYNSRTELPTPDGGVIDVSDKYELGQVNKDSGYGTLIDGRTLPHTVAPGCFLISACNNHYIEADPSRMSVVNAVTETDAGTWYWAMDAGTSMATPYVAGSVACWLEADPTLTVSDVVEVMRQTNAHDYPDAENPRHGLGWFDPYEGLKYVVRNAGISAGLDCQDNNPSVSINDNLMTVLNLAGGTLVVIITTVDGRIATVPQRIEDPVSEISLSHLARGVYVVTVSGSGLHAVSKKFVR